MTESILTGDQAAELIRHLHNVGLGKGYERVRMDRGTHPSDGSYYELGYSHGEVAARFSHQPNLLFRHVDPDNGTVFSRALAYNARLARLATSTDELGQQSDYLGVEAP